ncbi:hypothetical protein ACWE42_11415 [Sutcliffiella cohnii]
MLHSKESMTNEEQYIQEYIIYKKELLGKVRIMLEIAKEENLSPNVIESLQEEFKKHTPLNISQDELAELLLKERECNQIHEQTNKEYSSSYKYRENLANNRVNIWR